MSRTTSSVMVRLMSIRKEGSPQRRREGGDARVRFNVSPTRLLRMHCSMHFRQAATPRSWSPRPPRLRGEPAFSFSRRIRRSEHVDGVVDVPPDLVGVLVF